jgi:predicted ribosome quality control (RQC) complex YloA/Tae2 family protein
MITNYYTLKALAESWHADGHGSIIGDIFSQHRDELIVALDEADRDWMLHLSVDPSFHYMFRSDDYSKAKANVVTLLEEALGRTLQTVRMATRDRMLYFDLSGGLVVQVQLFGSRANVFLVEDGRIVDAFKNAEELIGETPPEPREAPAVDTWEVFRDRWKEDRNAVSQAISYTMLLFDRTLGREVVYRADITDKSPEDCTEEELRRMFEASQAVERALLSPHPHIYWQGRTPEKFSLIRLEHRSGDEEEAFEDLNRAVRVFVRSSLATRHFHALYDPLEKALTREQDRLERSVEHLEQELSQASRADEYERWGHLLMAAASRIEEGREEVELDDLFGEEDATVTIPLDPALSAIENAEEYYDRARSVRKSREEAEKRWSETRQRLERYREVLEELQEIESIREVKQFRREHSDFLADLLGQQDGQGDRVAFRQFEVAGGYTVWAGKNARQNDELLSEYARKYDYWMHARKVPGSHVILRRKDRNKEPSKRAIRAAASIAAYYSQARGSSLVPVQVTERKYVHKPKGGPPGRVRVDREEVVMVEPKLPD